MGGSSFLVSLAGQIEWIDLCTSYGSYYCDFEIVTGPNWKLLSGSECGVTQHLVPTFRNSKLAVNFPIEVIYKSTGPVGWPQLSFSIYNGNRMEGYARLFAPTQPGLHTLDCVLVKPVPLSLWDRFAQFLGYDPNYFSSPTNLITNNMLKTESLGNVQVSLNVVMQNFHQCGYDSGSMKWKHF